MTQNNNQKEDVDWNSLFTVSDFEGVPGNWTPLKRSDSEIACELANARFREIVEKYGQRLFGGKVLANDKDTAMIWCEYERPNLVKCTHSAILINVEKLK